MKNYPCYIEPTEFPDFPILWMFIISKESSVTVKIKIYDALSNFEKYKTKQKIAKLKRSYDYLEFVTVSKTKLTS